jgi:RES domain
MNSEEEIDEPKSKNLCSHCVGEAYLSAEIEHEGHSRRCSYCGRIAKTYTIGAMADRIEQVFEQHYSRTSDQPHGWQVTLLSDRESNYDWERDGEPVIWAIANAADISEEAARDIQTILEDKYCDFESAKLGEETEFDSDSHYEERPTSDHAWRREWSTFERSLKTEARFFSRTSAALLVSVFARIESMSSKDGRPAVIDAGPGTSLRAVYRARVFQSDEPPVAALCRPVEHLGPPPANVARAGRMNAHGVSVFYGANEPSVAIAEVRPPVGSKVAVARFEIIRRLRLLDLTALNAVTESGSLFDPGFATRLERAMFLRTLSERITRPVMPDDEAFDYLPTQAVADFLATEKVPALDGIAFPSVQAAGDVLNVVLFHKAARVETIELPKGTKVTATMGQWTEEGWETEYYVFEEVPPPEPPTGMRIEDPILEYAPTILLSAPGARLDPDPRQSTLRIDVDSIRMHFVRRVEYETIEHRVGRHRPEKGEPPF